MKLFTLEMSLNHRHPLKLNASERRRYWRKADINQLTISAESAEDDPEPTSVGSKSRNRAASCSALSCM
jgi:hypothetical protein